MSEKYRLTLQLFNSTSKVHIDKKNMRKTGGKGHKKLEVLVRATICTVCELALGGKMFHSQCECTSRHYDMTAVPWPKLTYVSSDISPQRQKSETDFNKVFIHSGQDFRETAV